MPVSGRAGEEPSPLRAAPLTNTIRSASLRPANIDVPPTNRWRQERRRPVTMTVPAEVRTVRTNGLFSDYGSDQIPASHRDLVECPPARPSTVMSSGHPQTSVMWCIRRGQCRRGATRCVAFPRSGTCAAIRTSRSSATTPLSVVTEVMVNGPDPVSWNVADAVFPWPRSHRRGNA